MFMSNNIFVVPMFENATVIEKTPFNTSHLEDPEDDKSLSGETSSSPYDEIEDITNRESGNLEKEQRQPSYPYESQFFFLLQ